MANKKLTELVELVAPHDDDLVYVVDVSDTSGDPTGTGKKVKLSNQIAIDQTARNEASDANDKAMAASPSSSVIGASDIDYTDGTAFSKTLAANTTFTFSNTVEGKAIVVVITNTASNYTATWPTVKWSGGVAPTQTPGAKIDIYTFIKVGDVIYGAVSPNHS